ncbi:uncharacterized protein LOC108158634 [Drosophila miranda]|uniref:uncharacterized protein LOC108158634 n=1 Tax=Drosophila miranda TaxID=7229 RepID=UPI0007E8635F|nr:uncharacterized protein LOC108158634 [Drosophila miranda]
MFTKGKPRTSSLNSQAKFKSQLESNSSLLNRSFPTAAELSRKNGSQLRQTKLTVCPKDKKLKYEGFVEEVPRIRAPHEFIYMPPPKLQPKSLCVASKTTTAPIKMEPMAMAEPPASPMSKRGRDLLSLVGRVDFCLTSHKMYPDLNAIWNVYGKLARIIEGKRCEHTLLVRCEGPILQGIYYDFEGDLNTLSIGCTVHLVGRFVGPNRLQTFRFNEVSILDWEQQFMRIENVSRYILMQNNAHK